jgi:predicted PurR-regulated permease PerM
MRMKLPRPGRRTAPEEMPDDATAPDRLPDAGTRGTAPAGTPAPGTERGVRMHKAIRSLAVVSAELLLVVAALVVLGYVIGALWGVLLPVVLGLLISTVLWPPTRFLRRHGWPPALAAAVVLIAALALFGGVIALIAPQVADQAGDLANQTVAALDNVQKWLEGPPFNIGEDQIGNAVDTVIQRLQENATDIAGYALTTASSIGNGLLNLVLALLLAFFFIKDGPRWTPWLAAQTGPRAAPHVIALSQKTWSTLSEFIRQQALVGFIDAFFIGLGLLILGVPLVIPLAVITFLGAFIPIIGAFVAGAFAVLIALVSNGFTTALIILAIVIAVQQLEGNVLQPIIQGRGFNLHAAVVILAVTAGGGLAGITGAFLAVPVAALIAVIYRYVRDQLDQRSPEVAADGTVAQVVAGDDGARLVAEPAGDGGNAARPGAAEPGAGPPATT